MLPTYIEFKDANLLSLDNILSTSDRSYSKVGVLCDSNTETFCLPKLVGDFEVFVIEPGEENKSIESCAKIWQWLTDANFGRDSLLVNLGGGVIGDMGGFSASSFKRGIDFIQIPTTLLAQVDASLGGKQGVDFSGFKNQIGCFRDPAKVIINPTFLESLPKRQLFSGFAEIIKHSLIRSSEFFDDLKNVSPNDQKNWIEIIKTSVAIKSAVVSEDPFENGQRKILNFGHTVGHALESYYLNDSENQLLHGEAIAIGIICEAWISSKVLNLDEKSLESIVTYILSIFERFDLIDLNSGSVAKAVEQDKKNSNGKIMMSLIPEIGVCQYNVEVSVDTVLESIEYYKRRCLD